MLPLTSCYTYHYIHTGRFDREIIILPPNAQHRLEILSAVLPPDRVQGGQTTLKYVADAAVGFVGADLASLCRKSVLSAFMRGNNDFNDDLIPVPVPDILIKIGGTIVTEVDLMQSLEQVGASALRGCNVSVPSTRWDEVGGAELAKLALKRAVEWVCGLINVYYNNHCVSVCLSHVLSWFDNS